MVTSAVAGNLDQAHYGTESVSFSEILLKCLDKQYSLVVYLMESVSQIKLGEVPAVLHLMSNFLWG